MIAVEPLGAETHLLLDARGATPARAGAGLRRARARRGACALASSRARILWFDAATRRAARPCALRP